MSLTVNSSASALQASMTRQSVAAHNVANVNTPGYSQYNVQQTDMAPDGTRIAGITRTHNSDPTTSNVDLVETSKEQMISKGSFSANAKVIKVKNEMLGSLLDIVG